MAHTGLGIALFQASTLLAAILVARQLGPARQGQFQLLVALSVVVTNFVNLGLDEAAAYGIPQHEVKDQAKVRGLVRYSLLSTTALSVCLGLVFYLNAGFFSDLIFDSPALETEMRLALFLLPAMLLLNITSGLLRGFGRSDLRAYVYYYLVGPGFLIVIFLLALSQLSLFEVEVVRTVSYAVAAVLAIFFVLRQTSRYEGDSFSWTDIKALHRFGATLILVRFAQYVVEQPTIDLLIVGRLEVASAAGSYYVAAKVGSIIALALAALTIVMGPVLSQATAAGDRNRLRTDYHWAARWMVLLGTMVGAAVIVLRRELLLIFGEEYAGATAIVIAFALAHSVAALLGPNTPLLLASGRAKLEAGLTAVFGIFMVVGGIVLGQLFGGTGVAVASSLAFAAMAVTRYVLCRRAFDIPHFFESLQYAAPAAGAGAIAYLADAVLDRGLFVIGPIYAGAFLLLAWPMLRRLLAHR